VDRAHEPRLKFGRWGVSILQSGVRVPRSVIVACKCKLRQIKIRTRKVFEGRVYVNKENPCEKKAQIAPHLAKEKERPKGKGSRNRPRRINDQLGVWSEKNRRGKKRFENGGEVTGAREGISRKAYSNTPRKSKEEVLGEGGNQKATTG